MVKVNDNVNRLYGDKGYLAELEHLCKLNLPWEKLQGKKVMLSGATGLIGSFLVDVLLRKNKDGLNCKIYALGRNKQKSIIRFSQWIDDEMYEFVSYDVNERLVDSDFDQIDYIMHLASNTHPKQYSTDPIGTIMTNVIGTKNLLDFAVSHNSRRFLFASSNEIYGENRGDVELFNEDYCGYINCNTLRAGYPESKRCGEALCQAYINQYKMDVVILRLTRSYGPTLLGDDSKALSQFIKKGIAGEDIVLKSDGSQLYSYTYVADAVSGLLTVLLKGENGSAYNVSNEKYDVSLKQVAEMIANYLGVKVVYDVPDAIEARGYSVATKARLDSEKLRLLGWIPQNDLATGLRKTLDILKRIQFGG